MNSRQAHINRIHKAMEALRTKKRVTLAPLAEAYDDFILELETVRDDAWHVIISIFSDEELLKLRGLERFLLELNVDLTKYSARQLQELLNLLQSNVSRMDHEIARHAVGDFIARAYPIEIAMKAFERLAEGLPREKHAAFVGLDILLRRADRKWESAVRNLHRRLSSDPEWVRGK
jgi:hypothetical protein